MTDTAQKIAEIREALRKATPGPWKLVMDSYDDEKDTYFPWMIINADGEEICDFSGGGDVKLENAHIMTNAPEWLRFLLSELEKRDEENQKLRKELDKQVEIGFSFECQLQSAQQEIKRLKQERAKLIEGLWWYADSRNWAGDVFAPPEGIPPEVDDGGQRARDILREVGVTVE